MVRAVRSFSRRYKAVRTHYDVYDLHFRLNCILAMFVRMKSKIQSGAMLFGDTNLQQFEDDVKYVVRYAMSELCCYFKSLCKF